MRLGSPKYTFVAKPLPDTIVRNGLALPDLAFEHTQPEMPAILVEVSCLSNEDEAELLTTDDYRARIAAALLRGIRSYSRDLDGVAKKEG